MSAHKIDLVGHAGLYPAKPLEDKSNFKITYRIDREGSVSQAVRLRLLDDRVREEVICAHFLSSYVRWILRDDVIGRVVSRDAPWDFSIELDGRDTFNLEITAVAEDEAEFRARMRENRLGKVIDKRAIPLSLLRKLHKDFPHERAQQIIDAAKASGAHRNVQVDNPWFGPMEPLYVGYRPVASLSLLECITNAIASKAAKPHPDKGKTILVIDNRSTAFDLAELRAAALAFNDLRAHSPFKEVWFYTGYYSDHDGQNAEWSFSPVLLPEATMQLFRKSVEQSGALPNEYGFVFGGFR
jgi:hypothetical protein